MKMKVKENFSFLGVRGEVYVCDEKGNNLKTVSPSLFVLNIDGFAFCVFNQEY